MAAKTYDYIVTLKQTKSLEAINWITQFALFIAILVMSYTLVKEPLDNSAKLIGVVFIVGIIVSWIYTRVSGESYKIALYVALMGFLIFMKNLWFAAGFVIMVILERFLKFKDEIGFDEEGVTFNTFPKKTYQWHEVANVVLKDGIITVDLHNNKIFQKEIETDVVPTMEKEFNDFCRQYLYKKQANTLAL
jgi:hypothetical protein